MEKAGKLVSVEIARESGEAWARVLWGSNEDDELIVPISTKNLPPIQWTDALLDEVLAAVHEEGNRLLKAKVK